MNVCLLSPAPSIQGRVPKEAYQANRVNISPLVCLLFTKHGFSIPILFLYLASPYKKIMVTQIPMQEKDSSFLKFGLWPIL
jgi:hypothetical protein